MKIKKPNNSQPRSNSGGCLGILMCLAWMKEQMWELMKLQLLVKIIKLGKPMNSMAKSNRLLLKN